MQARVLVPVKTLRLLCSLHGPASRGCRMACATGAGGAIDMEGEGRIVPKAPLAAKPETSREPAQATVALGVSVFILITGLPPPPGFVRRRAVGTPDRTVLAEKSVRGGEKPGKTFLTCDFSHPAAERPDGSG